jgi:hypothetical protein
MRALCCLFLCLTACCLFLLMAPEKKVKLMPKLLMPGQPYAGRAPGVVPMNLTLDKDAYELLRQQAPAKKAYGRFISRLIYEHCVRQEERQRLRAQMVGVLESEKE